MRLDARLERLERATGVNGPRPCPGCGHTPGNNKATNTVPRFVRWGEAPPDLGPEFCPACGRKLVFSLAFDAGG